MLQTYPKTAQTLLSPRIPRDSEHERYDPELEEELKECLFCLRRNAMMFDLEVDSDLIEQRIYERQALLCRYRYLLARARELGLHTILKNTSLLDKALLALTAGHFRPRNRKAPSSCAGLPGPPVARPLGELSKPCRF